MKHPTNHPTDWLIAIFAVLLLCGVLLNLGCSVEYGSKQQAELSAFSPVPELAFLNHYTIDLESSDLVTNWPDGYSCQFSFAEEQFVNVLSPSINGMSNCEAFGTSVYCPWFIHVHDTTNGIDLVFNALTEAHLSGDVIAKIWSDYTYCEWHAQGEVR